VRKRGRTWAIVIDVGRDPETGKRKQKWESGFKSKSEADDKLIELLGKKQRGEVIDPDKTPLCEYLTKWLDGRVDELAPLSVTQYRSVIRNHIEPESIAKMPIGKIRRAHVKAFEQTLRVKELSASTRNVVRAVLSRALADAVEGDLIGSNPVEGIRRQRDGRGQARSRPRFTVWTPAELLELLAAAEGDRLEALWRVAAATGARRGELLGLTWLGYSAETRKLEISQQVVPTRGGVSIAPCKTKGSHRTITLDEDTAAALETHRERQLAERDAAGDAYQDADLIFCDELGRPIYPQRLTERFAALRKTAGIRPGRLHDVRHSHATLLLTGDAKAEIPPTPLHVVSARLGHASPMVTLSVYAHVLPASDEHAADAIGRVFAPRLQEGR
jgi:integrase